MDQRPVNDHEAEIGAYFDRCAEEGLMHAFTAEEEGLLTIMERWWRIEPGHRVVEPGCGSGRLTRRLADRVGPTGRVLAFDLSGSMINQARRRALPAHVQLELASASCVPATDRSFDLAICLNLLPHLTEPARALAELARVLVPGGHLWIHHFAPRAEVNAFHRGLDGVVNRHEIPPDEELTRLLAGAGFVLEQLSDRADGYRVHAVKSRLV